MSQPSTPFSHTAADLFLPSMDQGQELSLADFDELFGLDGAEQAVFTPNNSDILDELGFTYGDGSFVPVDSSNTSTTSTLNFSSYDFDQNAPAYPTPRPNSPHPYPLDLQRAYPTTADDQESNHRPRPIRSQTNNVYLYSAQPSQSYGRRRSLSTGDTDRIATANSINNPTFIRLQAPRARSSTPEHKRRHGLQFLHGRSASQGPAPRGRPLNLTSTPYHVHNNTLVGGMLPTPIGTPLNEAMEAQDPNYGTGCTSASMTGLTTRSEDPFIRHMTRPEELARSRQIIEIGALVVTNYSNLDPRLESHSPNTNGTRVLKKLADIQEHLKDSEVEEVLSACGTIREALSMKIATEVINVADAAVEDHLAAPSIGVVELHCDLYDDHNDNEIMEMLMRENGVEGQETE